MKEIGLARAEGYAAGVREERERCAALVESYHGEFSANIRTSEDEPELLRVTDPEERQYARWAFLPDVAAALREGPK